MGPTGDDGSIEYHPPPDSRPDPSDTRDGSSSQESVVASPDGPGGDKTDPGPSDQFSNEIDMIPGVRNEQPTNSITEGIKNGNSVVFHNQR